jgi:parallel beta-helix repeat protein
MFIVLELLAFDNPLSYAIASTVITTTYDIEEVMLGSIGDNLTQGRSSTLDNGNVRSNIVDEEAILIAASPVPNVTAAPTNNSSLNQSSAGPGVNNNSPCIEYDNVNRTINLCGGNADLSTLKQSINGSQILNNTSNKNWVLNANITIANGATLFINSTDADWLRINSTDNEAYSIVVYGNLVIDRTKISSWNFTSNTEAQLANANKSTPRGYLLKHWQGTGYMNITNSNISSLGFNGLKDSWGIAYYSGSGSIIENNTLSSNFRGIYLTTNGSDIEVVNNTIQNSSQHGLSLYRAKNTKIFENIISGNTEHGISCIRECGNILVKANHISGNGKNGIALNDTISSVVEQNVFKDNMRSGIAIWNSSTNMVDGNIIQRNRLGTTIGQASYHNAISRNIITNSLSNGMLLESNSTNNKIEENMIDRSGGAGIYAKNVFNNTLIRNNITENYKNGVIFINTTKNVLVSNNVSYNTPFNYYLRSNSEFNVIRDTIFENATIRFFDKSSNIILENTDNRIIYNNKEVPINAYSTNTTVPLKPVTKNILVNTLDMFVIPSADNMEVFSVNKDFNNNQTYKKWSELIRVSDSKSIDENRGTKYIIGGLLPNTQMMVTMNNSFWNAYTSNSSGYITFLYEGNRVGDTEEKPPTIVREFEVQANNRATTATFVFLIILIAGSSAFILIWSILRKHKKRNPKTAEPGVSLSI